MAESKSVRLATAPRYERISISKMAREALARHGKKLAAKRKDKK